YWSHAGDRLSFQTTRAPYACDQIMSMPATSSAGAEAPATLLSSGKGRTTCAYYSADDQHVIYSSTAHLSDACPPTADMASRSVKLNGLEGHIRILGGDLKDAAALLGKASFTLAISNPPYIKHGGGLEGDSGARALARHEIGCTFDDVAKAASELLVPAGRFALVHRPDRLADIICSLRSWGLEPKNMRMVHTRASEPPVLVLVTSVKGASAGLKIGPSLLIYGEDGKYSEETNDIYFGE
ncbi:MAG TPA: hypothetical protein PK488_00250, partial [Bacillota bacterium]|nr:hypothetical protein [Bacillota bacterium]